MVKKVPKLVDVVCEQSLIVKKNKPFSVKLCLTDAYQIRISTDTMPTAPALTDNSVAKNKQENNNNKNDNNNNGTPSKKPAKSDAPLVTYETSGEGKKLPIVIFHCNALSQPQPMAAG